MKKCKKCNIEKPFNEFHKRKDSKDGHRNDCKECVCKHKKVYHQNNKDVINQKKRVYYKENRDDIISYQKKYRSVEENKKKIRDNKRDYHRNRRKNEPLYKLTCNLRILIGNSIKRKGYSKKTKTAKVLDCTWKEFKQHLESQFEPWMSWDNYGLYNGELNYGWDIDHIIPSSSATTKEELIKLNHYTNLQPLCSKVNRDIKKDKVN